MAAVAKRIIYQQFAKPVLVPAPATSAIFPVVSAIWVTPLSASLASASGITNPVLPPTGEIITVDKWFIPLGEPMRGKLRATEGVSVFVSLERPSPDRWVSALSIPIQPGRLPFGAYPFFTAPPAIIVSYGWSSGLSEPVRQQSRVAALQQFSAFTNLGAATPVESGKWFSGLSNPYLKQRYPVLSPDLAFVQTVAAPFATFWFSPLSSPAGQARLWLLAASQQTLAFYPLPIPNTPTPIDQMRWLAALSEPRRFPSGLIAAAQNAAYFTNIFPPPPPPSAGAIYTVSGGDVNERYPAAGVSLVPDPGLGTQKRTV